MVPKPVIARLLLQEVGPCWRCVAQNWHCLSLHVHLFRACWSLTITGPWVRSGSGRIYGQSVAAISVRPLAPPRRQGYEGARLLVDRSSSITRAWLLNMVNPVMGF